MPRTRALIPILAVIAAGCAGAPSSPAAPSASAVGITAGGPKPSFELTLGGIVDLPTYASDAAASIDNCAPAKAGGWTYMYAGGSPFVSVDLSVYSGAVDGATPSDFDLDIGAPAGQVRLVPSGRREGAKGTGTVRFEQAGDAVRITIDGAARTMVDGSNAGDTTVQLVLHCPR